MKKFRCLMGLLVVMAILVSCKSETTARPELLDAVNANVDLAIAEKMNLNDMKVYNASVVMDTEDLSFDVDGYLYGIYVEPGQRVSEGEVIASLVGKNFSTISNLEDEIESLEEQNEETFKQKAAELELSKLAGEDTAELELEFKHDKELAALKIDEKKARLAALKENDIGYIYITAPRDCTVVAITSTRRNGYVAAGTPVCALEKEDGCKITCSFISEKAINSFYSYYAVVDGEQYAIEYIPYTKAELKNLSANSIDPVSVFVPAEEIPGLEIGDFVAVITVADMVEDVLTIPINCIYSDRDGKFVYKVSDNARVRQAITTGVSNETYIEIIDGLEEGDKVYVKN